MIVGVTGNYGSGKDAVAEILQKMDFYHISFSDILREKLQEQGKEINRDNLINIGNELRKEYGNHILAELALEKTQEDKDYVFTSIRNPDEVRKLQERKYFSLINVTVPIEIRLERMLKRGRADEQTLTLEELREKEARENTNDPSKQQLNKVSEMANITLDNSSTLDYLENKVREVIKELYSK